MGPAIQEAFEDRHVALRAMWARLIVWPVLVASAAMFLWMARSLVTGQIPFTGDLLHFHYPLRDFYARALANGQRFDWMPSLLGGFYVVGEGQLGAYHPLHWLLYRWLSLDTAFAVELVAAYPFVFAGMWLFLRRWCESAPALFGAMLFTFCGFNLSHGVHINMVAIIAHVPWLLCAIHWAFTSSDRRGRLASCAAIGGLTGSQLLLGHPQAVWWSLLIEAGYAVLLMATSPQVPLRGAAIVVSGKVIGLAIGAVQLLATLHALQHSVRASSDEVFASTFSLPPIHLFQLLHPYLLWGRVLRWTELPDAGDEFAAYGGAVALVLAVWWLALYPTLRARALTSTTDRLGLFASMFGLAGLWLATGSRGGLYNVQTWLPLVREFRAPVRYVLFTQLALAVVAAIALTRLIHAMARTETSFRRALWAPWAIVAASALSAPWLASKFSDRAATSPGIMVAMLGPMLLLAAALLLTLATRGARWALVGLVLLAACDQALYGLGGAIAWRDFLTRPQAVRFLGESLPPLAAGRIVCCRFPNLYLLGGYRLLDGYVGLTPRKLLNYQQPQALRAAQVGYVHRMFQDSAHVPRVEAVSGDWYRLADPLPRARLVTDARVSTEPAIDLEQLSVERSALVTHELKLTGGEAGDVEITRDDPGEIQVATRAVSRQLLVVSESFDDGWVGEVDGGPVPVEQVNGDFIGCVVPAGQHNVSLEFRPVHLAVGKIVSLCGVLLIAMLAAVSLLRS